MNFTSRTKLVVCVLAPCASQKSCMFTTISPPLPTSCPPCSGVHVVARHFLIIFMAMAEENIGECCIADTASPAEVCRRIESLVLDFLINLTAKIPFINPQFLIRKNHKTASFREGEDRLKRWYILDRTYGRNLIGNQGFQVTAFLRVWKVLALSYELLQNGQMATQREIFYRLLSDCHVIFQKQRHVNEAIQEVASLLRCTRCSLGIYASSRGAVTGRLLIRESASSKWIDCARLGQAGMAIPGNVPLLEGYQFQTDAQQILVVEKDAVFQRLAEDRFFDTVPTILVTAKGYPDLATRVMLHRLHESFPLLPIVGLVDWNPPGFAILSVYKFGSLRMGLEAPKYACDIKWLGIRSRDLEWVGEEGTQPLSPRDLTLLYNMLNSPHLSGYPSYLRELEAMQQEGVRCEIEALYVNGYDFLSTFVASKLVCGDYI